MIRKLKLKLLERSTIEGDSPVSVRFAVIVVS
jgi:hypothetical protein